MEDKTKKQNVFIIPIVIMIVIFVILFVPAGSFIYWQAWVYWFETSMLVFFIPVYFMKRDPGLLSRRNEFKEKEPPKAINRLLSFLYTAGYLIPGFDYRFHWSDVPAGIVIGANAIVCLSYILIIFVFKENSYASTIINVEGKQKVITTGPYSVVRHPMYTALLISSLMTPFALGSYWALITFLLIIPTLITRVLKEERLLLRDLPGYKEYCQQTRYRLIPLVW